MKSLFPILLCLLLLPLTACQPDFSGSRMGTPRGLHMSYTAFHTTEKQTLSLKAGEEIALSLVSQAGTLSIASAVGTGGNGALPGGAPFLWRNGGKSTRGCAPGPRGGKSFFPPHPFSPGYCRSSDFLRSAYLACGL